MDLMNNNFFVRFDTFFCVSIHIREIIFVICNNTKNTLLIAQVGFQDRKVEVIPSQKRMGWYWADPKGKL